MFKYNTNKHNCLQKCKTRLVVCGNQQKNYDLPTRATTLTIILLHVLLAVAVKFNLETLQLNAVNTFVYADLDKMMFLRMPPRYGKNNKVLRLNKAFYGLQQSFFLWQQKLMKEIERLGFKTIPQELYVVQKYSIIGFFYIDDIVFAYKKDQTNKIKRIRESLQQRLTIKKIGKLKWFLGLHVV